MNLTNTAPALIVALLLGFLSGCATQVTETPAQAVRASVPLSEYQNVIVVEAELASIYADQGPNLKAAKKINEVLLDQVSMHLDNVKSVTLAEYTENDYSTQGGPKNDSRDKTIH